MMKKSEQDRTRIQEQRDKNIQKKKAEELESMRRKSHLVTGNKKLEVKESSKFKPTIKSSKNNIQT